MPLKRQPQFTLARDGLTRRVSVKHGQSSSTLIRQRAETARAIQAARFADIHKANILVNGDMGPAEAHSSVNWTRRANS